MTRHTAIALTALGLVALTGCFGSPPDQPRVGTGGPNSAAVAYLSRVDADGSGLLDGDERLDEGGSGALDPHNERGWACPKGWTYAGQRRIGDRQEMVCVESSGGVVLYLTRSDADGSGLLDGDEILLEGGSGTSDRDNERGWACPKGWTYLGLRALDSGEEVVCYMAPGG